MNTALRPLTLGLLAGLALGFGLGQFLQSPSPRDGLPPILTGSAQPLAPDQDIGSSPALVAPRRGTNSSAARELAGARTHSPASVSEAAVRRARESATPMAVASGSCWLEIRVRDGLGQPLPGVVLRARPQHSRGTLRRALGAGAPSRESMDSRLRKAAQSIALDQATLRTGTTDELGVCRFDGLPESAWQIEAYREGYVIDTSGRKATAHSNSQVILEAVPTFDLDITVLDETGAPVQQATISVSASEQNRRSREYPWNAGQPFRLTEGLYSLRALSSEGLESGQMFRFARAASDEVDFDLRAGEAPEPLTFQLKARVGIYGRILSSQGTSALTTTRVRHTLLAAGQAADKSLLSSERDEGSSAREGTYEILDLEPGHYLVGLALDWNSPAVMAVAVEVDSGVVQQDLVVPESDPSATLVISTFDPMGRPVNATGFTFEVKHEGGSSTSVIRPKRESLGVYLYPKPNALTGKPRKGAIYSLMGFHKRFGSVQIEFTRDQPKVELHFTEPASLDVLVAGIVGSTYEGRLFVNVNPEGPDSHRGLSHGERLDSGGHHIFKHLSPGPNTVRLSLMDQLPQDGWYGRSDVVAVLDVVLTTGKNRAVIAVPALFSLPVSAPGAEDGAEASVWPKNDPDDEGTQTLRSTYRSSPVDAGGNTTLEDLLPGKYILQVPGFKQQIVEIPGGPVTMEPDKPQPKNGG